MFSYTEISRWLSFPLDPITIEDWIANREFLGETEGPKDLDKELEQAYQIEMLRHKKVSAAKDMDAFVLASGAELSGSQQLNEGVWLIAPVGTVNGKEKKAVEIEISGGLKDEAPRADTRGIFPPLLRRERNPSEAEDTSHSSPDLRPESSAKGDKKNIGPREFLVIDLDPGHNYEVKAKFAGNLKIDKKSDVKVSLSGYSKLIIDTRGRPISFDEPKVQREKLGKWKQL